jgi:putative PIN family toxin of toxin-antitoxin system
VRVVLDTNVIVSAMVSPNGNCASILAAAGVGKLRIIIDERILLEYATVLHRPKLKLNPAKVELILAQIRDMGERVTAPPAGIHLPDETDAKFVEVALAAVADCVVTGNTRHFPAKACKGVRILKPTQFLARLAGKMPRP